MGKKRDAIKKAEQADIEISRKLGIKRNSLPVRILGWIGELGDQPPLIAFSTMIAAAGVMRRDPQIVRAGGHMLAAHLAATLAKAIVKRSVDRTRPHLLVEHGHYEVGPGERNEGPYNSFPSGHTAGAVAVARALSRDYPEAAPYAYAAAATIAAVQIPKCAHFLSDVLAGAVVGVAAEAAVNALTDRLAPPRAATAP